ncbi:hypothetical protein B0J18DRAFT_134664 [Chaetomium sp. MPI-SDFR-AT-0129]|nr:hypothetical protein B0J18DRAFT_134664 [Chaetomium sp. MPI-SDFR-AT-0129]
MLDCGHVFCVACLQDFYNSAIKEGDITAVKCLTPDCAKDRAKGTKSSGKKRKKPRTFINPSELLQIPLDQETVKRYVTLKYKVELESDKNTIYCPRQWCNGAARSKKHKKPQGLNLAETSDDSASDDDDDNDDNDNDDNADRPEGEVGSKPYKPDDELLAICEECAFAFCSRCHQSWHGEFFRCIPRRDKQELTADELASLEYMRLHSTPCPTCGVPAQKTHGCNHMICSRCQSHFCYLCSSWLDPGNPYQHFNEAPDGRITGCYMRLWELEEGDGDDAGHGFAGGAGGAAVAPPPRVVAIEDLIPIIEEPDDAEDVIAAAPPPPEPPVNGAQQVGIAREGPLVLRIAANQPAAAGRGGPRGRQPAAGGGAAVPGGIIPPAVPQPPGPARGGGPAARGPRAAAQRGARNRGRGGGNAGLAQRLNQNHHPHNNQLPINNNNPGGRPHAPLARPRHADPHNVAGDDGGGGGGDAGLAPAHEEWVRHFVQLALNDMEGGSDDEEF